jgi:hypothetical protein
MTYSHWRMISQTILLPSYFENLNFSTSHSSICSLSCLCFAHSAVSPICSRGSFLHPSSIAHGLSLTFHDGQRPTNSWASQSHSHFPPCLSQVTQPPHLQVAAFLCNIAPANMLPMTPLGLATALGLLGLLTLTPCASPSSRGSFLHPSSIDHSLSLTFYDRQRPTNS